MMDKDKLRKADIFSGSLIFLTGLFIVSQSLKMPMKDSWGGVQNVWFVSPAIFPLFVGAIIMLLGGMLIRTAVKEVGIKALKTLSSFILSRDFLQFLKLEKNLRFYAVVFILFSFVFLFIPRVDFFLAAIEFLLVFITMFYLNDRTMLVKLFLFYAAQVLIFILFLITGLNTFFSVYANYPGDWLVLSYILSFAVYVYQLTKDNPEFKKKYRISLIIAVISPLLVGMIFKYLLLVPMPFEGMLVELLDLVWYM
ncbi:MAG: hypothetical protein H8D87_03395 [Deltaproteobacteria bacterium]|uniref:hypothetical protein n=1 Tax=Desulfobacula sp. TaxID=2593537 RepID=UPI0019BFBFDB|nr:hypothetical protein [Candidatus Desulfobacula maris]MBL6996108.1 hypothetical protein [Desulfobacula sp.]